MFRRFYGGVLLLSGLGLLSGCQPTIPAGTSKSAIPAKSASVPVLIRPEPPSNMYVGSQVCRECHRDIAERYATHPMGRSASAVASAPQIESFSQPAVVAPGDFVYTAVSEGHRQFHHEMLRGADATTLYDQTVEIDFLLGSGQRGRSYLAVQGDHLVISPLTWYSQRQTWDLSPGYDKTQRHFERRAVEGCLQCHTGRTAVGPRPDTVVMPVFHEAAIGCERCHGPAEQHVTWRRSHPKGEDSTLDPIVNPAHLPPHEREAVCNQCHLQGGERVLRYGRSEYDFRPGKDLSDVWVIFTQGNGASANKTTTAVNQVPQMQSSRCFVESQGRLGCTSCHDPHGLPTPVERVDYYRERCLACHSTKSRCQLDEANRRSRQPDDSCIDCHMPKLPTSDVPHTSQTDHRIVRSPSSARPKGNEPVSEQLTLLDGMRDRIPALELDRARGLLMARYARDMKDILLASAAVEILNTLPPTNDDVDVWRALGDLYSMQNRPDVAEDYWKRALQAAPQDEFTLRNLGILYHDAGRDAEAAEMFARCLKINRWDRIAAGRMVHVLGRLQRLSEAMTLAEQTVADFPWDTQLQEWLANAYQAEGRTADADRCRSILGRLRRSP